jgi:hypothetical protein
MKRVITIQSANDIITNSSSEIIIMQGSDEEKQRVMEIFADLWKAARIPNDSYWGYRSYIADRDFHDEDWGYSVKKGDLVIESETDNSIPYWLLEFLEWGTPLKADRYHLG